MALPKSGKTDSNVLNLDDVRNKHKKSTRTTSSNTHARNVDEKHISTADFENGVRTKDESEQTTAGTEDTPSPQNTNSPDNDVIKTPAKRSLVSNRRFDKVKVKRIKAELAEGSYEINYLRVADRFIEHERFG